jgi:hypothetical protein
MLLLTGLSALIWLVLLVGRSGFWRARPRIEDEVAPEPTAWPAVVAVIPARDEVATVAEALRSLLAQDYRARPMPSWSTTTARTRPGRSPSACAARPPATARGDRRTPLARRLVGQALGDRGRAAMR